MKHILNNLSEVEKNSIREQHKGGMKVMTESFSKLLNSKLGDVKPLVSEQTLPSSGTTSGETTTNPFKDQSLLNKYVGKQFQTYSMDMVSNPNDIERYRTGVFEISKVTPSISNVENRLIFDLGDAGKATYSCTNGGGDVIHILRTGESFGDFLKAPSFTKELKQNFCTIGSDSKIIAKVDYPTP
jgi:hypothetical protein